MVHKNFTNCSQINILYFSVFVYLNCVHKRGKIKKWGKKYNIFSGLYTQDYFYLTAFSGVYRKWFSCWIVISVDQDKADAFFYALGIAYVDCIAAVPIGTADGKFGQGLGDAGIDD